MPATKVVVTIPNETSYDVRIGAHITETLGERMRQIPELASVERVLIVTDNNVMPLYGALVKASLRKAGFRICDIVVASGECSKSIEVVHEIWEAMAQLSLGRDCAVIALGGGVVGDLAGFAACAYMRGVPVIQVPTTLLAMVDSSVGGKCGVNLEAGKNLVGAFKQPAYVCADTVLLATLDKHEWVSGCAEIAKMSVIDSDDFFFWLDNKAYELASRDTVVVNEAIARCVVLKARVVGVDAAERTGARECLNYGHTLGHAIESLAGYGMFSHGAAVSEGMRFAARLSASLAGAPRDFVAAQDAILDKLGLPALSWSASPPQMLAAMKRDKKVRHGVVRFVLPHDLGVWELTDVADDIILEHLDAWARSKE